MLAHILSGCYLPTQPDRERFQFRADDFDQSRGRTMPSSGNIIT